MIDHAGTVEPVYQPTWHGPSLSSAAAEEPLHLQRYGSPRGSYRTASERGVGGHAAVIDARSFASSDGLGGVLSTFGAPSEWWHDSIILGRLSALALRYFAAKATSGPWRAWKSYVHAGRSDKMLEQRRRAQLALRSWRYRTLTRGRLQNKLPLIMKLKQLQHATLAPCWERLRQAVFMRRDVSRRLRLLQVIERKILGMTAMAHYHQSLLRLGLGGFWMAAQLSPGGGSPKAASGSRGRGKPTATDGSHVEQVVRRAWRRWSFATRMWMSSSEYQARETEAWLAGECSTPRSMATSLRFQGVSSTPAAASTFYGGSPVVLDSTGPSVDALSGTAFEFPQRFNEPFPANNFAEGAGGGASPLYLNAAAMSPSSPRSRLTYQQARSSSGAQARLHSNMEKPLTEPPQRRDFQEAARYVATTPPGAGYGRQVSPSACAARQSVADFKFAADSDEETDMYHATGDDGHSAAARAAAQKVAAWRAAGPPPGGSYGDSLLAMGVPYGGPAMMSPPGRQVSPAGARQAAIETDNYWQLRTQMGRAPQARPVTPVKLRQR